MTALAIVLSVVAISALIDRLTHRKRQNGAPKTVEPCYFAVKHRSAGSPSVYWGPFGSLDEAKRWANSHRVQAGIIEALHPDTPEKEWWG